MKKSSPRLKRDVGVFGAIMMGLGSIVGTGVFVSLGIAAGITGSSMILALFLAGCLAVCNGLSSAQLAAAHPVSGGTYEYGYQFIHPWVGYLAGWLFVCAKSASAATAAIGFGGYFIQLLQTTSISSWQIGIVLLALVTLISVLGIKQSNRTNILIVSITLVTLLSFVFFLFPHVQVSNFKFLNSSDRFPGALNFLEATALMFVAYTGYGRIATLGEEIKNPKKNIPKAILFTLGISFTLYMIVALVSIGTIGAERFYLFTIEKAAPLQLIANLKNYPWLAVVLSLGAMTAMIGVLLNLVLGLSRVVYAMSKKQDLPKGLSKINASSHSPYSAIIFTSIVIGSLILMKDVKATWSFSAFTVLAYYTITNIAALRLPKKDRLYPRIFAWLGLLGCFGLVFWVDQNALILGTILIAIGVFWRIVFKRFLL